MSKLKPVYLSQLLNRENKKVVCRWDQRWGGYGGEVYLETNSITTTMSYHTFTAALSTCGGIKGEEDIVGRSIWRHRNNVIFSDQQPHVKQLLHSIEFISWAWMRAKPEKFGATYYDWMIQPKQCLAAVKASDRKRQTNLIKR